jgi:hypothetical protein
MTLSLMRLKEGKQLTASFGLVGIILAQKLTRLQWQRIRLRNFPTTTESYPSRLEVVFSQGFLFAI